MSWNNGNEYRDAVLMFNLTKLQRKASQSRMLTHMKLYDCSKEASNEVIVSKKKEDKITGCRQVPEKNIKALIDT